jgi:hypothetical protein
MTARITSTLIGLVVLAIWPAIGAGQKPPEGEPTVAIPVEFASPAPAPCEPSRSCPPPGWFTGLEIMEVQPHLGPLPFDHPEPPVQDLGWTVAPEVILGYRFQEGRALLISYRYMASDGTADSIYADGSQVRTRLDTHWFGLDWLFRQNGPIWGFTSQFETGLRLANLFTDTSYMNAFADTRSQPYWYASRISDSFLGVGPHGGFEFGWQFDALGLRLFTSLDIGLLFGHTDEKVDGSAAALAPGNLPPQPNSTTRSNTMLDVRWEIGASWRPPAHPGLCLGIGYRREDYTWLGQYFEDQGPFLRGEIGF